MAVQECPNAAGIRQRLRPSPRRLGLVANGCPDSGCRCIFYRHFAARLRPAPASIHLSEPTVLDRIGNATCERKTDGFSAQHSLAHPI
ncbi:hypothetical protein CBM2599_B20134 [Cupriavidus taiwanensis]|uniref:Uncharacterized protein n=2 Tax=Cupriavidus TaxID=106589 RepID=A0A375HRU9_9BURK|nr:hypothetical protein CBM2599_B20134 [Cupriavidus taiwanensis]SOY98596.1 hypothetical protein CBM2600_B30130 [Cupriavidus taiwanensis]SOZ39729.1 hypothetical protein CBM2605_B40060 [Cupriavidus neocaledonicus]SPD60941.1 protein of unknown function [Cupriavidus neocaledonicus]SPD66680.1 protein of unknown function [Cupriavidus taiwanensis]